MQDFERSSGMVLHVSGTQVSQHPVDFVLSRRAFTLGSWLHQAFAAGFLIVAEPKDE